MKNKVTAGIFAFFLGWIGVHRFYLGEVGKGIFYALFFWTGIPAIIAIIDAIVFLTMDDDVFNYKYNKDFYYHQHPQENRRPHYKPERRATYNRYEDSPKERFQERQRERERLKQQPTQPTQPRQQPQAPIKKKNPFKDEGTKLYKDYDFKGAIKAYHKALKISPKDSIIHFNLACLYSLEEDIQHAYLHLSKAVENGFSMYDKIREHDHLAFLRTDDSFDAFVANGYKIPNPYAAQNAIQQLPPRQEDEIDLMSDEVIRKLEQLGKLKERGILTEAEFNMQKAKLLNKR